MLANKEWESIAKTMYNNSKLIGPDPVFAQAIRLFESEFFVETDSLPPGERKKVYEYPSLVIELKQHAFSKSFVETFVDRKLALLRETKSDHLLSYAAQHQDRPLAVQILEEIKAKAPEVLAHARRQNVSIKATLTTGENSKTTRLFKSRQEQFFFEAVREAFPTYHPYPNVAVSCIIAYSAIKDSLSSDEREYFFKAIIDSVVFDSGNEYEPKFFIELDSQHHDNECAVKNDRMKDGIFRAANVKLIRIRAYDTNEISTEKFKQLVLEVMRGL
ncbi:hypothetical protein C1H70_04535 [Halomonas urumqiensis]|uniref:DUF2726 domain-containing protein n=2 Tax=Halomonas urumqiensis TaxID=1684789 RepID=A0A2N7UMZ8_9GAMM|nr:hypothetical protein C1H70_04535 [Halomonas urumqiensis]PTB02445.1 DUF2726 domain-containing protein [Halomonas urumqiensis]